MSIKFSPIAVAEKATLGVQFSAHRLDLNALAGFSSPIMGFDHFRMNGPTFAPHPHAGFSAVSYVFEDSLGELRNRDSLGNDLVIEAGAIVWTQAARGVVHDEYPVTVGTQVHGLQLFVNLSRAHKNLAPEMLHASAGDVPVVHRAEGTQVRVLAGRFEDVEGPINPVEPFDFYDLQLRSTFTYEMPTGRNVLLYLLSGQATVASADAAHSLGAHQAIAARSATDSAVLQITASGEAHLLLLSGVDPQEPVVVHGSFIMNDPAGLHAAYSRYVEGKMGRLNPLTAAQ